MTFDPGSKYIMTSPPRKRDEHIVNKQTFIEFAFLGVLMGGLAFYNFSSFVIRIGDSFNSGHNLYPRATTVAYLTIVFSQFLNNKKMLYSIAISIVLVLLVIYIPGLNSYLGFVLVVFSDWISVFLAADIFLLAHELIKVYKRTFSL